MGFHWLAGSSCHGQLLETGRLDYRSRLIDSEGPDLEQSVCSSATAHVYLQHVSATCP